MSDHRILIGKRSYTRHGSYRVYIPEEDDYPRDAQERYCVFAAVSGDDNTIYCIPIGDCLALTLTDALNLSVQHAMRMIDDGTIADEIRPSSP